MTPADRKQRTIEESERILERAIMAAQMDFDAGLVSNETLCRWVAEAQEAHALNCAVAEAEHELETGEAFNPPSSRFKAARLTGFEGDNGSAANA